MVASAPRDGPAPRNGGGPAPAAGIVWLIAAVSVASVLAPACAPAAGVEQADQPAIFAPMGEPLPDIGPHLRERFERGLAVAVDRVAPSEGLGPQFNATFCAACHEKPVPGGSAARYRNAFIRVPAGPTPGVIMQRQFTVDERVRAPDHESTSTVARSPIPFFGAGLLAEIPFEEIAGRADPGDVDGDGISGRVNFERGFVGRFGRKAQISSLTDFVRLALLDHLGLTTDPVAREDVDLGLDLEQGPIELPTRDDDAIADPELSGEAVSDLVVFVALLAAPQRAPATDEIEAGRMLFEACGCVDCHVAALEGPRGSIPAYTDLLLHDLGAELADGIAVGEASGSEFRTQPLWGLGVAGPYMHDGRADTIDAAIRWHAGEASRAREAYVALSVPEREAIEVFLVSLGGDGHDGGGLLHPDARIPPPGTPGGPLSALSEPQLARFSRGRQLFDRDFGATEGLGPTFNGDSCRACHFDPAIGGAGPPGVDVIHHGSLTQDGAFEPPDAGTMAPRHSTAWVRPGVDASANLYERRQTPTTLGLGLIDAIAQDAILARADPEDADGDGIRGRPHFGPDGRLGRFGWRAQVPSLADFARDALANELGITVVRSESSFGRVEDGDGIADPEIAAAQFDDLVFFMTQLAPPPRQAWNPEAEARGEVLFAEVGCARCHTPELPTRDGRPVALFSDLLLHDVAPAQSHPIPQGDANRGYRTPPLWGLRDSAPYLHDGTAHTVHAAIRAHAGEAEASADAYAALPELDRADLLAFLQSL